MITEIEDFFTKGCGRCARFATPECSTRAWIDGLNALRRICRGAGLEETVKWGHPTYVHAGRNIAILGAFRGDFRLSFMNPGLLEDTGGVLQPQGPNSRTPGTIRFTGTQQVRAMEPVIRVFLRQLMEHARSGTKPPGTKPPGTEREIVPCDELIEALDTDPELAEAFHALTPGRQRSYLFDLGRAKRPATRRARIEKYRGGILAGKGPSER